MSFYEIFISFVSGILLGPFIKTLLENLVERLFGKIIKVSFFQYFDIYINIEHRIGSQYQVKYDPFLHLYDVTELGETKENIIMPYTVHVDKNDRVAKILNNGKLKIKFKMNRVKIHNFAFIESDKGKSFPQEDAEVDITKEDFESPALRRFTLVMYPPHNVSEGELNVIIEKMDMGPIQRLRLKPSVRVNCVPVKQKLLKIKFQK